jgi:eukaryotic translation initiation factor 2C
MAGHLGVNIDIAASVFLRGGISLIDYVLEVTGARNISEFEGPKRDRLIRDLKGIMVRTTHRGDMKQRFKIASISTLPAKDVTFEDGNGKMISIVDYFRDVYQIQVKYPYLPVVYKVFFGVLKYLGK